MYIYNGAGVGSRGAADQDWAGVAANAWHHHHRGVLYVCTHMHTCVHAYAYAYM